MELKCRAALRPEWSAPFSVKRGASFRLSSTVPLNCYVMRHSLQVQVTGREIGAP